MLYVRALVPNHCDPFDRILAAQAELEQLVLVTADSQLAAFFCGQHCEG